MARNTQLLDLLAQLRSETGRSQSVSIGVDEADNLKQQLRRKQEELYDEHDWLHIKVQRTVALAAGQRYYDLPSDLDFDRIESIKLNYNSVYQNITKGICLTDYSIFDSNTTSPERSSPVLKWDIRDTGVTEQIEVWPIPNDNTQTLYFFGTKKLSPLIQESDRADLDDIMIVMFLAAEILSRQKSPDANNKLELANRRKNVLKRNAAKNSPVIQIGLGKKQPSAGRESISIVVS